MEMILKWLEHKELGSDTQIFCDGVGVLGLAKPKKIGGYVPDVFCSMPSTGHMIIGGAKTPNDLETRHTKNQLEAYADYLALHSESGELVIATRFAWAPCARSILNNLNSVRTKGKPEVQVLCEFGIWG
ncbi:hypothetical protein [Ruegeria arenilitoris]|uniref:hypothetical protein n=1 Tax=Ruegeria arenilitoris TaxID=1173585 RepID=UPI00147E4505|nr:hypothetical protein [Ruegeria arenilitoris]